MKTLMTLALLLVAQQSHALIDLDRPFYTGLADSVYPTHDAPGVAYAIPKALFRVNPVQISKKENYWVAKFDVGVSELNLRALEAGLAAAGQQGMRVRYFRALNAKLIDGSSTSIAHSFKYKVTALADPGDIYGPVTYVLEIEKKPVIFGGDKAEKLIKHLFSDPNDDHLIQMNYEFNAIRGGQPYLGQSSVHIFVGDHPLAEPVSPEPVVKPNSNSIFRTGPIGTIPIHTNSVSARTELIPLAEPEILLDSQVDCWDKIQPGQICLKAQ